ncbi:hypothetical protein WICPIJ_000609 [Wickerhamomyces pijperi]|uniref:Cell wall synthesis protein KRE9 n=1 Tax=Wickerhamomyces pijperi TaxID=599730 RepID=A0A9P8TRI7_WICPI|nr:hypothetical protein WICPIJ_000609 [Wickerhamomyces pijperi]
MQIISYTSFLHPLLIFLFSYFTSVKADVAISKPLVGSSYDASSGSASVLIQWIESNTTPTLDTIESYVFTVCTGPNTKIHAFGKVGEATADDLNGSYKYTVDIENTIGADGYYYIQIYAVNPLGSTIHYSNRFELTGMTGEYVPSVGIVSTPPDPQTSLKGGSEATLLSYNSASFTIPYSLQTGPARFAPMQTQPGTKVTRAKSDWVRRYPTSAVTYYSTIRHSLDQTTTVTPGWNYQISSMVNYASPAPFPSDNGGWYNPSDRLKLRKPTLRATDDIIAQITGSQDSSTVTETSTTSSV